jgi:hypothetical protein
MSSSVGFTDEGVAVVEDACPSGHKSGSAPPHGLSWSADCRGQRTVVVSGLSWFADS